MPLARVAPLSMMRARVRSKSDGRPLFGQRPSCTLQDAGIRWDVSSAITLTLPTATSCFGGSHGACEERRRDTYGRVPMKICENLRSASTKRHVGRNRIHYEM